MKKPTIGRWEKEKREFYKNVNYDEAELGCNWSQDDLWAWIESKFTQQEEETKDKWWEELWDAINKILHEHYLGALTDEGVDRKLQSLKRRKNDR